MSTPRCSQEHLRREKERRELEEKRKRREEKRRARLLKQRQLIDEYLAKDDLQVYGSLGRVRRVELLISSRYSNPLSQDSNAVRDEADLAAEIQRQFSMEVR